MLVGVIVGVSLLVGVCVGVSVLVGVIVFVTVAVDVAGAGARYRDWETDRKSTRLNSSHSRASRMPSSA